MTADDAEGSSESDDGSSAFDDDASDTPESGNYRIEKSFRGISRRLAVHYLRNLGGRPIVDGDPAPEPSSIDDEVVTAVGADGWEAQLSSRKVSPGGSLQLTEVTVVFTGQEPAVESIVEAFSKKAMRAGG